MSHMFDQVLLAVGITILSSCCHCPTPVHMPYVSGTTQALKRCLQDPGGQDPWGIRKTFSKEEQYKSCMLDTLDLSEMEDHATEAEKLMQEGLDEMR